VLYHRGYSGNKYVAFISISSFTSPIVFGPVDRIVNTNHYRTAKETATCLIYQRFVGTMANMAFDSERPRAYPPQLPQPWQLPLDF
jgi:hypothetical protein